jgi:hypothetical protein
MLSDINIVYPEGLIIPELNTKEETKEDYNYFKHFVTGLNRQNIVKRIFKMSENIFSFTVTEDSKVWEMTEQELDTLEQKY